MAGRQSRLGVFWGGVVRTVCGIGAVIGILVVGGRAQVWLNGVASDVAAIRSSAIITDQDKLIQEMRQALADRDKQVQELNKKLAAANDLLALNPTDAQYTITNHVLLLALASIVENINDKKQDAPDMARSLKDCWTTCSSSLNAQGLMQSGYSGIDPTVYLTKYPQKRINLKTGQIFNAE